jgi:hypothetical protein
MQQEHNASSQSSLNTMDPRKMLVEQLGQLLLANIEQAALIEKLKADLENLKQSASEAK